MKIQKGDCFYNTDNAGENKSVLNYTLILDIIKEEDNVERVSYCTIQLIKDKFNNKILNYSVGYDNNRYINGFMEYIRHKSKIDKSNIFDIIYHPFEEILTSVRI